MMPPVGAVELTGDRNPLHYVAELARGDAVRRPDRPRRGDIRPAERPGRRGPPGPGTVFLGVNRRFLAPVRPGDEITAEAEVLEVHPTKPVARLRTTITNAGGVVVLDGEAHVYRVPLPAS